MAIFGSIFGRGVALSRFGADVQKLRQKFGPYMRRVITVGTAYTAQYRPIPPNTAQYRPIPPNTAQYRPIPPNTAQYRPIPPNTAQYRPIPPNTAKYRQIPPNTAKYRQIPPNTAKYRQILRIWRYLTVDYHQFGDNIV